MSVTAEAKKSVVLADDSDIEIREISGRKGIAEFVKFQNILFKGTPAYVPSLNFDELDTLDPNKNPAYEYCETKFFMAYLGGKPVGRICGLLNREYNRCWNRKCVRNLSGSQPKATLFPSLFTVSRVVTLQALSIKAAATLAN